MAQRAESYHCPMVVKAKEGIGIERVAAKEWGGRLPCRPTLSFHWLYSTDSATKRFVALSVE